GKLARASDTDKADEDLGEQIRHVIPHVAGLSLTAVGNAELARRTLDAEERPAVREQFKEIVAAFACAGEEVRIAGKEGRYEAPPFGAIEAKAGPQHGSVASEVLPDLPERKKAARVARLVRGAV